MCRDVFTVQPELLRAKIKVRAHIVLVDTIRIAIVREHASNVRVELTRKRKDRRMFSRAFPSADMDITHQLASFHVSSVQETHTQLSHRLADSRTVKLVPQTPTHSNQRRLANTSVVPSVQLELIHQPDWRHVHPVHRTFIKICLV